MGGLFSRSRDAPSPQIRVNVEQSIEDANMARVPKVAVTRQYELTLVMQASCHGCLARARNREEELWELERCAGK